MNRSTGQVASAVMQPIPVLAIACLVLNDHYLKANWGHPITGKVSDFVGLLFFPLLLVALVEVGQVACRCYRGPSHRLLVGAALATGLVFALVQVFPPMTELYRVGLAALQRPMLALDVVLTTGSLEGIPRVQVTPDPTDLLALPAVGVAYLIGRRGMTTTSD